MFLAIKLIIAGATPQEFFLYMQKIVGRWWINDFRTPGEDIDATILELNMEKLKDNVMSLTLL